MAKAYPAPTTTYILEMSAEEVQVVVDCLGFTCGSNKRGDAARRVYGELENLGFGCGSEDILNAEDLEIRFIAPFESSKD